MLLFTGCGKQLAPSPIPATPGKTERQIKREERYRAWQAYRHKRKTEKLTRKANAESEKRKRQEAKVEKKTAERQLKKQHPEVQQRMKESQKEAEKNRPYRTLRQRLRFWKYK